MLRIKLSATLNHGARSGKFLANGNGNFTCTVERTLTLRLVYTYYEMAKQPDFDLTFSRLLSTIFYFYFFKLTHAAYIKPFVILKYHNINFMLKLFLSCFNYYI